MPVQFLPFFRRRWFYLTTPLPALVIGVLLMQRHAVSPAVWGQNLAAGLLLTVCCAALSAAPALRFRHSWWLVAAALALASLLATFADAGFDGVHRWLRVGPLRFQAAAICLPPLILALGENRVSAGNQSAGWLVPLLGLSTMTLLALQPDAAQATAFAGALLVLFFFRSRPTWVAWFAALLSVACAVWAWQRPDPLLPVRHVEGIVGLAAQSGGLWLLASLTSLALLPLPFLFDRRSDGNISSKALALGVYFCLQILMPRFGFFPVPLLGFGLSPIIGYFIALGWLVTSNRLPS